MFPLSNWPDTPALFRKLVLGGITISSKSAVVCAVTNPKIVEIKSTVNGTLIICAKI
jgi:hypothetical protein